jgi:peptidoglycan hydrolase CwlO-like protein
MIKILFILSALVMVVASVFAYQNGRKLVEIRGSAALVHSQIRTELREITSVVEEIKKVAGDIAAVQTNVDTEAEKLKNYRLKISQLDTDNKNTEADYKVKDSEMNKFNGELAKLPAGFNPKTIAEDLNKIRQEIVELQTAAEAKKGEVQQQDDKVAAAQKALDEVMARVENRKKAFDRNGMEASIVAVNNDWGFVVVDAGEKEGITPSTKLLITRGTSTVGKLSIMSVEGNRTVATILPDTLAPGMAPAPGDRVILETLVQ